MNRACHPRSYLGSLLHGKRKKQFSSAAATLYQPQRRSNSVNLIVAGALLEHSDELCSHPEHSSLTEADLVYSVQKGKRAIDNTYLDHQSPNSAVEP